MRNLNNSKLRIIPLGGLEQIGMNITAFEFEDSIIAVSYTHLRSGTENVPGIAGLGEAVKEIYTDFNEKMERLYGLREYFVRNNIAMIIELLIKRPYINVYIRMRFLASFWTT